MDYYAMRPTEAGAMSVFLLSDNLPQRPHTPPTYSQLSARVVRSRCAPLTDAPEDRWWIDCEVHGVGCLSPSYLLTFRSARRTHRRLLIERVSGPVTMCTVNGYAGG